MRAASALVLASFLVAGCSTTAQPTEAPAPYASAPYATTIRAIPPLAAGKSTKGEVAASLGRTTAVAFDSGYEVWVYLIKPSTEGDSETTELVLLFDPQGVLAKSRLRSSSSTPRTSPSG